VSECESGIVWKKAVTNASPATNERSNPVAGIVTSASDAHCPQAVASASFDFSQHLDN